MSKDEIAFLMGVAAEPLSDDIRRVFADWCEDNGQNDRGELVRLQLEAVPLEAHRDAGCPHNHGVQGRIAFCALCHRLEQIDEREKEILRNLIPNKRGGRVGATQALRHWARPLARAGHSWIFRRGFMEEATVRTPFWLEWGPACVTLHPLRRVRLIDASPGSMLDGGGPFGWYRCSLSYLSHLTAIGGVDARSDHYVFEPLWDAIEGGREDGCWKVFGSEGVAWAAYDRAALAWAKREAGRQAYGVEALAKAVRWP